MKTLFKWLFRLIALLVGLMLERGVDFLGPGAGGAAVAPAGAGGAFTNSVSAEARKAADAVTATPKKHP